MAIISLPTLWAITLLTLCAAQQCPTQPENGICSINTFNSTLSLIGASIEKIGIVPPGGCFRGSPADDIAVTGRPNVAADVGGSCALIVKNGSYRFGLLLPDNSAWKGSFLAVGNYAFAGGINFIDMGFGVSIYGMATMSTDTGHSSSEGDMTWAKGNTQAQEDWGFRAMNGSVAIAKQLVDAYYGRNPSFSYYSGCSTGGREGLKQIQVDQTSFNGLLIGAPAWDQYHMMPWITKLGADYSKPEANGNFTFNQWFGMVVKIRAACDLKDSVPDNIISRPDLCNFDEIAPLLQCNETVKDYCLNENQIPTARQIYQDYVIGGNPDPVFYGPELGSEVELGLTIGGYLNNTNPTGFDREWFKNFMGYPDNYVYNDSALTDAVDKNPGNATADGFNISKFAQNRGKIILYQGLADGVIPAKSTMNFYNKTKEDTDGDVDSYMRYFPVPGMRHCWLSDTDLEGNAFAPWMLGGAGQVNLVTPSEAGQVLGNPELDAFARLQQWVEAAAADPTAAGPTNITATTWFTWNQTIWRQRPICAYPRMAALKDGADLNKKESWECR
ncbi:tannase and feruloyl esterase [Zopfia rhizophila CBS 207.26]|uniref:Carboxylic ester hydrolase n=1 Tax=Zopfia rhizophila CBS 207.26 TaxID=1314779 RepID=A0A6A6E6S6_9PEZI|nr:tannase and feruloyl esterase [Zopfia rhizophila CBS 207.26]